MKIAWTMLCGLLMTSAVAAAELPIEQIYGSAAGCATAAKASDIPGGKVVAVTPEHVLSGDAVCPFLAIADGKSDDPANKAWEADISCEAGHEEAVPGKLLIVHNAAEDKLTLSVLDGDGPKGTLAACPAP
ncbi:MAG: hypothetical protein HY371_07440 [Devosia nanyangense]|jgi:hypothetical protein|uniref:Uncharacterized protein n=1 Tax=Paradevosia shaoguanensis TaxID=1335043 RepID=A0AA41QK79_9HYPH|nr:hypothetical protein [Paradevosia shaoguanensis]MBI4046636.1 hypothetical protein [Devosia nanyangense]MCF1741190.1 hypothetical protein [Paradevosia shaoguanensis]MCI0125673.1 hypothetical protein [Paradevosia shaoguanensis]